MQRVLGRGSLVLFSRATSWVLQGQLLLVSGAREAAYARMVVTTVHSLQSYARMHLSTPEADSEVHRSRQFPFSVEETSAIFLQSPFSIATRRATDL
jgi:hypothetical protein